MHSGSFDLCRSTNLLHCHITNGYLRSVAEYLQIPMQGRPTDIYEDNQPAIDIIEAGQITSRVKHMATAIAIIHEEYKKGTV